MDAVKICNSKESPGSLPEVTKEPENKHVKKQNRFYSTRKPRLSAPDASLANPTVLQKEVVTL